MEETFVLKKSSFDQAGRVELTFTDGDLQYEDALSAHHYGRTDGRDSLLKIAVSPAGTKVLRREADAYDRVGGRHTAFGRLLGFEIARDPVCLMVTRRGVPVSRCDPGLRLDAAQLGRAARDLFGGLDALADLGFAHRAISADSVFWDGLHIEIQEFGHVEPLGSLAELTGSALASPTGLPVSDVPDVQAAARLLHRLATGSASGGTPEAMVRELARIDAGLAEALAPALHARPGHAPAPKEMVGRLWQRGPSTSTTPTTPPQNPTAAEAPPTPPAPQPPPTPPPAREAHLEHRMEFRELRRQQREFRHGGTAESAPVSPRQGGPVQRAPKQEAPASGSRGLLLFGLFAVVVLVLVVMVVR